MEIRFLQDEDKAGICHLSYQINSDHHKHEPRYFREPVAIGEDWEFWKQSHEKEGGFLLVCLINDKVVGFVAAEIYPMPDLPFLTKMTRCRIATIVVSDDHQREGAGTALFNRVCEIAKDRGAIDIGLEVISYNTGAQEFYEQLGFKNFAYRMSRSLA